MILQEINITNFKNIAAAQLSFSEKLNCFLGDNGMGKSNLLDAIYYLSFCRSFTGANDAMMIRSGEEFALLQARYQRRGAQEDLNVSLGGRRRKSVKRGGKEYPRLSRHIGVFPAVLISPADMDLVTGSGEVRRRFMDMVISQSNPAYLEALIKYNGALENRNKLLRSEIRDANLFMAYETVMAAYGTLITSARRDFIGHLAEIHRKYYQTIGSSAEEPSMRLVSQLDSAQGEKGFADMLDHNRERDRILGFTSAGPHRDDMEMMLNGLPLRRSASQGQSKTYTIALRLAQYDFLSDKAEVKPILLLDDIFDKLDSSRVEQIIGLVTESHFGQIFITDTNRKHLDEILSRQSAPQSLWSVTDGEFKLINA